MQPSRGVCALVALLLAAATTAAGGAVEDEIKAIYACVVCTSRTQLHWPHWMERSA